MPAVDAIVGAVGGIGVAAVGGWFARKRARGAVRDTDAEVLWAELRKELDDVREERRNDRLEIIRLQAELRRAEHGAADAENRARDAEARALRAEDEVARLSRRIEAIEARNRAHDLGEPGGL